MKHVKQSTEHHELAGKFRYYVLLSASLLQNIPTLGWSDGTSTRSRSLRPAASCRFLKLANLKTIGLAKSRTIFGWFGPPLKKDMKVPWNRDTPSHHPFLDGIFHEINHPYLSTTIYGHHHTLATSWSQLWPRCCPLPAAARMQPLLRLRCLSSGMETIGVYYRRKFRSQSSNSMDRWKSRGGKSQRGSKKVWRHQRRGREGRKKRQVRKKVEKPWFTVYLWLRRVEK